MRTPPLVATLAVVTALLAACGGGSDGGGGAPAPTTVSISGVVADGPLQGATACYDLDDDGVCEAGEPTSAPSDADGRWSFSVAQADAGRHGVVVNVPATAVDKDTGAAVGTAFTLRAPPTGAAGAGSVFVSPLTTLVVARAASNGGTVADATASVQTQLGLTASPLADFVAGADAGAARLARVINTVGIEVTRLAVAAAVPADQTQALVSSATLGNLPALAALSAGATGTPAEVAATVAQTTLAERNLSAATVVAQAQIAAQVAAPAPAGAASGPFVSLRDFRYASASNYSWRLFTGDDSQRDANGVYVANELRRNVVGGVAQVFNRNTAYWTGSAWKVCEREWQVSANTAASGVAPATGRYCDASRSETRIVSASIAGRRMADVVSEIRAFPLPDSGGLPTQWGPEPSLLGEAVFPAGSMLSTRAQTNDLGNTERYILTDKPRVAPSFKHAATLADLERMAGNFVDPALVVSNVNTLFLDDVDAAAPADPALRAVKRHRAALNPANDAVRYFACDVRNADNTSINCVATGDGTSAITTQGDSRVLRLGSGYPSALTTAVHRQRLFVERDGVVFNGYRDLQRSHNHQRLNTTAWIALRDELGLAAHVEATAPVTDGPVEFLRTFSYSDANNYSYRLFEGTGVADGTGTYTLDDNRVNVVGGVRQPFVFNSEFWTGTDWYACPNDLVNVLRYTLAPRNSTYCRAFVNTTTEPVTVTLDGRNMADVFRDIRWYPSKDGTFDFANYGANPDTTPLLQAGTFPPGSTMYYQRIDQTREPEQVFLGDANLVRTATSATSSAPYESYPITTTLEEAISINAGNYGGGPLNGNTTLSVFRYFLPTPTDPAFTTEVGYRVAFDALGNKARFFRHNRLVGNNFSTNYVAILDTTYTIETTGGYRVIKFAQTPDEVLERGGYMRLIVQRAGEVRYGQQTRIYPGGQHNIRLNGVSVEAVRAQLGLVAP